jgi:predicted transcriptional regulator
MSGLTLGAHSILDAEMPPLTQKVINRLRRWCKAGWGRQTEVAKYLGEPPQIITDWFSKSRKRNPTSEQILQVMKFLEDKSAPP